jgi:hypothetical protein
MLAVSIGGGVLGELLLGGGGVDETGVVDEGEALAVGDRAVVVVDEGAVSCPPKLRVETDCAEWMANCLWNAASSRRSACAVGAVVSATAFGSRPRPRPPLARRSLFAGGW